jgi:hypothetical protein
VAYSYVFGNAKRKATGTVEQTMYGPVAVGATCTILSCYVANVTASDVRVTIRLVNGSSGYPRAYNLLLPAHSAMVPFADGFKIDLEPGDRVTVVSNTAASVDSVVSYAERTIS